MYGNPQPLLGTDAEINRMKGMVMDLAHPVGLNRIVRIARIAAREDTVQAREDLLTLVQGVSILSWTSWAFVDQIPGIRSV
jgi:hypothetical protein